MEAPFALIHILYSLKYCFIMKRNKIGCINCTLMSLMSRLKSYTSMIINKINNMQFCVI